MRRYWGFAALMSALIGWVALVSGRVASSAVAFILVLSVAALGYMCFPGAAPVVRGADSQRGVLPQQLLGSADGLSSPTAQVAEDQDGLSAKSVA